MNYIEIFLPLMVVHILVLPIGSVIRVINVIKHRSVGIVGEATVRHIHGGLLGNKLTEIVQTGDRRRTLDPHVPVVAYLQTIHSLV